VPPDGAPACKFLERVVASSGIGRSRPEIGGSPGRPMHLGKLAFELLGRGALPSIAPDLGSNAPGNLSPYSSIRTRTNSDTEEPWAATASNLPRVRIQLLDLSPCASAISSLCTYIYVRSQYIVPQARRAEAETQYREASMPYSWKHAREASGILAEGPRNSRPRNRRLQHLKEAARLRPRSGRPLRYRRGLIESNRGSHDPIGWSRQALSYNFV